MLQSNIRRGELDREVTFIKPVKETGSANSDRITGWVEVDEDPQVFARKKDLPGRDVVTADRLVYAQRTVWTVDYREDLTIENRLVYNTRVYEVIAVTETEGSRKRYVDVMTNLIDTEVWT